MADYYDLTRSFIYKCPALKLPQSFVQRLGMAAQIVPLQGLTDEQAQAIVDRLNHPGSDDSIRGDAGFPSEQTVREAMAVMTLGKVPAWADAVLKAEAERLAAAGVAPAPMKQCDCAAHSKADCICGAWDGAAGVETGDAPSLPARVLAMCKARGWSLHWTHRGAYLHLESSELIEAVRGKHGDPLGEAADVLLVLMSITESNGIAWSDVLAQCVRTVEKLEAAPRYKGEEFTDAAAGVKGQHTHADPRLERAQQAMDVRMRSGSAAAGVLGTPETGDGGQKQ